MLSKQIYDICIDRDGYSGTPFIFNSIKTDTNSEKPIQAYDNLDIMEEAEA